MNEDNESFNLDPPEDLDITPKVKDLKNKSKYESADFEEFFTEKGFVVEDAKIKPRSFFSVTGGLIGALCLSALAGGLIMVPSVMYISAGAQVAEPLVEAWKKMPEKLEGVQLGERNKIVDVNGAQIAEFWTEDRIFLESLDQVGQQNIDALLASEDKDFYTHGAMDVVGTAKAALRGSGGGSGLTQQLVKNLQFYDLAGSDKESATEGSINRKVKELKLSIGLEEEYTKDEILLQYFNTVAFGGPNTYSIEAAAQYFFSKPAHELSIAQSAALIGSVQNPSVYNLGSSDEAVVVSVKDRQAYVLGRLLVNENITQEEHAAALVEDLAITPKSSQGNCVSSQYPFYCDYVIDYLMASEKFGESIEERAAILSKGGLTIKAYVDSGLQNTLQNQLSNSFGNENRIVAPTAVVEPGTGGVVAMAANRGYGSGAGNTEINLPDVKTGTGSTYKMIALAAAYEAGFTDAQLSFSTQCPLFPGVNYDAPANGFVNSAGCTYQAGYLNPKQGTAWSSNTYFLTLAMKIGMDKVIAMSDSLGLTMDPGMSERSLSMVLGSAGNTPIDMAAAFATFANNGVYCPATPIVDYKYDDGTSPMVPETYDPASESCRSVMSPATASKVLQSMRANTVPGEVKDAYGTEAHIPGYDAVGKSGTNEHLNLAWGQVSKDYSVFINIYDMDNPNTGIDNFYWRGTYNAPSIAAIEGSDVIRNFLSAQNPDRRPLDFNNTDKKWVKTTVDSREYFTIPSFMGMEPAEALATARSLGIAAEVSKDPRESPTYLSPGVIVEQSIVAGEQLPVGSKKELILYIGE